MVNSTAGWAEEQFPWARRLWSLGDIMDRLDAPVLQRHLAKLRREQARIEFGTDDKKKERLSEKSRKGYREHISAILGQVEKFGITGSVTSLHTLLNQIDREKFTYGAFDQSWRSFETLYQGELRYVYLFSLNPKEVGLYTRPLEGWKEISEHFESAVRDIFEAKKCFAFGRYGASVFHSLLIVERGLVQLGEMLPGTDHQRGWTPITNQISAILRKKHRDRSDFEKLHIAFFEQMQGLIESLKNAWRNKVSHTDGHLVIVTSDFAPEVAEDILHATRAFMRRLATDGPLAANGRQP